MEKLLFLPGALGNTRLWEPVALCLSHAGAREFVSWPGLGAAPPDRSVRGVDDMVEREIRSITGPVVLLPQSMGGLIALRAALAAPANIRGLVLSVTSGGLDLAAYGAADWRPQFAEENPGTPPWFLKARDDLTSELGRIAIPTLLLWGDADPISPVAVGKRLEELLPDAELVVVRGGQHDLVATHAAEVVPHIDRYLERIHV